MKAIIDLANARHPSSETPPDPTDAKRAAFA
jgi:hypothetical protein